MASAGRPVATARSRSAMRARKAGSWAVGLASVCGSSPGSTVEARWAAACAGAGGAGGTRTAAGSAPPHPCGRRAGRLRPTTSAAATASASGTSRYSAALEARDRAGACPPARLEACARAISARPPAQPPHARRPGGAARVKSTGRQLSHLLPAVAREAMRADGGPVPRREPQFEGLGGYPSASWSRGRLVPVGSARAFGVPPAEPLPPVGACDADAVRAPERGVRRRFSARAASQRARTSSTASRAFAACGLCLWLLHVLDVSGPLEAYAFPLAGVAALGAVVVGIVRYRPPRVSCWYALGLAVVLFVIGGSLRVVYSTLGNLGATRSLVPDALVLPGYLLLMGGLLGFVFARRFRTSDRGEIMLDAAIASLAVFSCAWVFFIRTLLVHNHVPIPVRFVLIAYPTMSTFLVAVAFHLKFSPGSQRRSLSRWVVVMTMLILVGDILYMLAELHRVTIASQLLDAPYVLAFVVAGAISLHPDMIELSAPRRVADPFRSRARLVIVAGRLAIPAVPFITQVPGSVSDHVVMSVTLFALIGAAAYRIFRALEASMNSEARLSHQATHDLLTGLPNRGLVQHYIEEALGTANLRGLHVAVLFLDLDRFKLVNDTFGHGHGDELLVEVAHRLRSAVRSGDLISRIGGDEFVIVLTDVANLDDAVGLAERVRRSLTEPFRVRDSEIFVTASIGVTLADHASGSAEAEVMIRDADNAMYRAKAQGRNAVAVFDHSMRRQVSERLALEHDLRHALANGELRLH